MTQEHAAVAPAPAPEGDGADTERLVLRVQELTEKLESMAEGPGRDFAEELMTAVMQMYGVGLERIVDVLAAEGEGVRGIRDALIGDELVASLLLIHDLYPVPLEERVASALDQVRPYMESHGGNVELIEVRDGIARLRLEGSCSSCKASTSTLELAVRQALEAEAPDLEGMDVEGIVEDDSPITGVPLEMAPAPPSWLDLEGVGDVAAEEMVTADAAGDSLIVANVEGTLLAYRNECAGCGQPLDGGELTHGALACPSCKRSYFLPRAGRSMDDDRLQLAPVPLLRENGAVKVAVRA